MLRMIYFQDFISLKIYISTNQNTNEGFSVPKEIIQFRDIEDPSLMFLTGPSRILDVASTIVKLIKIEREFC